MKNQSQRYLLFTLFVAFLLVLWVLLPSLNDPFQIEEDVRNLPWIWLLKDQTLFSRYPFFQEQIQMVSFGNIQWQYVINNPVYGLIIQLGSVVASPLSLVKLLPFPLMLVATYYAFRLGQTAVNDRFAVVFALTFATLNLTLHTEVSVIAGLQRSFVSLFVLALAYYLLVDHHGRAALTLFLSATIYIPILPVCGLAFLINCFNWRNPDNYPWKKRIKWDALLWLIGSGVAILIFMFPLFQQQLSPPNNLSPPTKVEESAPEIAKEEAEEILHPLENPKYTLQGSKPLFIFFPLIGRGGIASGPSVGILIGLFMFFLLASLPLLKSKFQRPPIILTQLLISSIIVYILAWLTVFIVDRFLLYIPSRHTQTTFFIVLLFMTLQNALPAFKAWSEWINKHKRKVAFILFLGTLGAIVALIWMMLDQGVKIPLITVTILLIVLLAICWQLFSQPPSTPKPKTEAPKLPKWGSSFIIIGLLLIAFSYVRFASPVFLNPTTDERAMYEYLKTLPTDALISGHPCTLDGVPIFTQRNILFNCEEFGYVSDQTVSATLKAFYSNDPQEILTYCANYGVDYLVIDTETWLTYERIESNKFFYEPFASSLQTDFLSQPQFTLASLDPDRYIFASGPIFIVPCVEDTFS